MAHVPNAARILLIPALAWLLSKLIRRLIRRLERLAFDEAGISIPFPQLTVHLPGDRRARPADGSQLAPPERPSR